MAAPVNLQVSFSPLTLGHGATAAIDGTVLHVSGDAATNITPIDNSSLVYFRVTVPPAAGSITVAGVPGSDFTLAQAIAGQVLYHNNTNTAASSDSFSVWARCNDGSFTTPLAPHFVTAATANAAGAEEVGIYFGAMLVGAADSNIFNAHFTSPSRNHVPFTVTTTVPNSVLLVCFAASGGNLGTGIPPAQTVISIGFAGLSFTRLSQQIHHIYQPSFAGGATVNMTMEVWWALAPTAVSGTFTLTTQPLGVTGTVLRTDVTVFSGLANPAAPFDTNASNFQQFISTAPPWTGMVMTPNAPEYRVLAWVYEYVAGNVNAVSPMVPVPGAMPRGYGIVNSEPDTINNSYFWHSAGRGGPVAAAASISFTGPIPAAKLAMDNVVCTAQATLLSNNLVSLRWSDDRGHSFGSPVSQDIGEAGEYRTSLQWQRLAYARDRVFEISWSVPMRTALQGCWVDVTPAQS